MKIFVGKALAGFVIVACSFFGRIAFAQDSFCFSDDYGDSICDDSTTTDAVSAADSAESAAIAAQATAAQQAAAAQQAEANEQAQFNAIEAQQASFTAQLNQAEVLQEQQQEAYLQAEAQQASQEATAEQNAQVAAAAQVTAELIAEQTALQQQEAAKAAYSAAVQAANEQLAAIKQTIANFESNAPTGASTSLTTFAALTNASEKSSIIASGKYNYIDLLFANDTTDSAPAMDAAANLILTTNAPVVLNGQEVAAILNSPTGATLSRALGIPSSPTNYLVYADAVIATGNVAGTLPGLANTSYISGQACKDCLVELEGSLNSADGTIPAQYQGLVQLAEIPQMIQADCTWTAPDGTVTSKLLYSQDADELATRVTALNARCIFTYHTIH